MDISMKTERSISDMNKKIKLICTLSALSFVFIVPGGCGGVSSEENQAPEISGVGNLVIAQYESLNLYQGIVALDKEDGDITDKMEIKVVPAVKHDGGTYMFEKQGNYKIVYSVEDSFGNSVEESAMLNVSSRKLSREFLGTNGFSLAVADGVKAVSNGIANGGVYRIKLAGAEIASDAVISKTFSLVEKQNYTFEYKVKSSAVGAVRIFINDAEYAQKQLMSSSEQVLSFDYTVPETVNEDAVEPVTQAEEGQEETPTPIEPIKVDTKIDIQIGGLRDAVFELYSVKFGSDDIKTEYTEQLDNLNYMDNKHDRFDGAKGSVTPIEGGLSLKITEPGADIWRGGVFINTHVPIAVGDKFKISFDAKSKSDKSFEVLVQDQQWGPDEVKKTLTFPKDGNTGIVDYEITADANYRDGIWLRIQSGDKINEVEFKNLSIKKLGSNKDIIAFDGFAESHAADNGADQVLNIENGIAYLEIKSFGSRDWHNKLESAAFDADTKADKLVITFKVKSNNRVKVVFAAPRAGGWDPNLVYRQMYIEKGERYYTIVTDDIPGEGKHKLVWQFGAVENQILDNVNNSVKLEISNICINYRHPLFDRVTNN